MENHKIWGVFCWDRGTREPRPERPAMRMGLENSSHFNFGKLFRNSSLEYFKGD